MLQLDATEEDRKLFLEETTELLQLLDEDLVRLEKEQSNPDLLQEIFRAAHTIKGSSAVIGHHQMAHLTHAMETVLDALRKSTLSVSTAAVDALLESLDLLRALTEEVETLEEAGVEIGGAVQRLEALLTKEPAAAAQQGSPPVISGDADPSTKRVRVGLVESPWKAVRALQVLLEVGSVTSVLSTIPSQEQIEREEVYDTVEVAVSRYADEVAIREQLLTIPDLGEITFIAPRAGPEEPADEAVPLAAVADQEGSPSPVGSPSRGARTAKTVRIDVERLDNLLNLVGELVIDRTRLNRIGAELEGLCGDSEAVQNLVEASMHVGRITDQLQEEIMKSRMLPIETVFNRLPRLVRDLAHKMGKQVDFVMDGQETELDRSVIEEIGDPLLHILRNAVDHGIENPAVRRASGKPERGTIRIAAFHEDHYIVITIEDDGRGIDPDALREAAVRKGLIPRDAADKLIDRDAMRLVFIPGLSTAAVVSDVSGRGVGMDIVRANIEKLNGSVDVESDPGSGTRFTIRLPLTLAIIQALLVAVAGNIYAIPLVAVKEILRVPVSTIRSVNRREVIQLRERVLPLLRLRNVFGDAPGAGDGQRCLVVAVRMGPSQVGLVVDNLIGEQEIVIKPLGKLVGDVEGLSGAAILGDGRVALIVDVTSLLRRVIEDFNQEVARDNRRLVTAFA